jgi:glycosyltransferase involved in cell wall biosynthesis
MTDISVSVVIPTLNSARTLGDTLRAVRDQAEEQGNFEVIVADSKSVDGTQEIGRKFGATVLETSKRGPAAGRNVGLFHASGKIVAYLDSDTIPTRRWLHEITAPFRDLSTVIVGGRTLSFMPETPAERFMSALHNEWNSIARLDFPFIESMNMAVRRDPAISIGGWAENMLTGEDADFSIRMTHAFQTRLVYAPQALIFHRNRTTDDDLRKQAWGYGQGAAHMYMKYPDILNWNFTTSAKLLGTLAYRTIAPIATRLGMAFGYASKEDLWYSYYLRFWSWWYWSGFVSMHLNHAYKPAPKTPPFGRTAIGQKLQCITREESNTELGCLIT